MKKNEIRIAKREIDFEREDVSLKWPDDFDQNLIQEYCNNYIRQRSLKSKRSNEEILVNNRLGRKEGRKFFPNSACTLLFANDPRLIFPGAYIRFMKFAGYEERTGAQYNLIDGKDFWIQGPLPKLILNAEEKIEREIRNFTRLSDGQFRTKPEYPKDVWLEAVVNACVHRSYNFRNMVISVKMFDDKIIIESPGGFKPPTTAQTIADVGHNPRNPYLMEALFYFNIVKCAHEGVRRMNVIMGEEKLPIPEFIEQTKDASYVRVILRNDVESRKIFIDADADIPIDASKYRLLEEKDKTIVNYLAERGSINVTEASRLLGISWKPAKNVLLKLMNMEICQYEKHEIEGKTNPRKRFILVKQ